LLSSANGISNTAHHKTFFQAKASLVGCVFVILQGLSNFSYTHTKMHPEVLFSKNVSF